jgi:hypothetical protein
MSVAKLRCKHCKEYFKRETMVQFPSGRFCTKDHAVQWSIDNQDKGRKKIDQAERKAINQAKKSNLKTRKDAAKKACHDYIRVRDSGKPCICCGKPLGTNYHAGHFLESGNNPQIRYDEDNIHGQRLDCNFFRGGDSGSYKENLIDKIGEFAVNQLLNLQGGTVKRTPDDYLVIEKYYKEKLKELQK